MIDDEPADRPHECGPSRPPAARARAAERLLITSALFGIVGGGDRLPAYRLPAGAVLPDLGGLPAFWRPRPIEPIRALDRPVVDLRSGSCAAFGAVPDAITVRVVTENASGQRSVVSHFTKATKGPLARALVTSRAEISRITALARVARRAGPRVEAHRRASPGSRHLNGSARCGSRLWHPGRRHRTNVQVRPRCRKDV